MLVIRSSNTFMLEKAYVWKVLLDDFLGIAYECRFEDGVADYHLELENGAELILEDAFFGQRAEEDYVNEDLIPTAVVSLNHALTDNQDVPVIYGTPNCVASEAQISCGADVVASSFFMLTRWEEYVVEQRDEYNRFPLEASLAYRSGFHQQPVVNQYTELLWRMLLHLDPGLARKKRAFRVVPTHNVAQIRKWRGFSQLGSPNFLQGENLQMAFQNLQTLVEVKLGRKDDPYDTFDYLMRASEKFGLQSRFYFMAGGETEHDNHYRLNQRNVQELLETINNRGHRIGFCPSFNAHTRPLLWQQERDKLRALAPQRITKGRQHQLRFEVPTTWQIWDDADMLVDSSLGYPEQPGFRCGTCYAFPVFNFLTRETLSIYESPLVCSETSLIDHMRLSPEEAEQEVHRIYSEVKRYWGNFVLQWSNTALFTKKHAPYRPLYEKILRGW
ncbi:MAG: polysaccharide deacetylase family protein [Tunicatimonas sp.]